ncbi:hypothetical protein KJZ71_03015 [Patescibacteria group bacterium]|jgi:EAL domain-containing protein (putative c-di-GMP-specific phosphodiesterase class I)|uniref:Uncharacterized protein n=1 Tax=candidate division WWE3 bacterium TaxID=2053526 RepID=A0A928TS20_UNCKA|nr:hypothetical protein [candidate division WWE3 bacterium]MCL4732749.1 hypothetical protein [Patescibacteria group bacterium]MDL1952933.1 hypothetical protein [Candidatus Uhrbacteria bacterium UHB]RIL00652.1 MAG: hypothetical protein DCC77_03830 [Candidatus Uhrbacteria bacterium]
MTKSSRNTTGKMRVNLRRIKLLELLAVIPEHGETDEGNAEIFISLAEDESLLFELSEHMRRQVERRLQSVRAQRSSRAAFPGSEDGTGHE